MAFKLAYLEEDQMYHSLREEKVSNEHAERISRKIARHFKLDMRVINFRGQHDRGRAWRFGIVTVSNNPSLLVVAHELNHFLIWKKYPDKKVNHGSKRWQRSLVRIIQYCENKNWWREEEQRLQEKHQQSEERKIKKEEYKKTPSYKLEQIQKAIKRWESKKKRAENTLKRLYRRERNWKAKT